MAVEESAADAVARSACVSYKPNCCFIASTLRLKNNTLDFWS